MQTIEQETEADLFEVVLYFEGNSWLFSTFAHASFMQEALERAEKEFSVHSLYHQLGGKKFKATAAYVMRARDDRSFTKRDGKWRAAQGPAGEQATSRKGVSFSLGETIEEAVGAVSS